MSVGFVRARQRFTERILLSLFLNCNSSSLRCAGSNGLLYFNFMLTASAEIGLAIDNSVLSVKTGFVTLYQILERRQCNWKHSCPFRYFNSLHSMKGIFFSYGRMCILVSEYYPPVGSDIVKHALDKKSDVLVSFWSFPLPSVAIIIVKYNLNRNWCDR